MKLISTYYKTTMTGVFCMLVATLAFSRDYSTTDTRRVFWNKFDVEVEKDNSIVLTWNVTEYNNRNFVVQHSTDGMSWEDIVIVPSKNSAESTTDYSYRYITKSTGKQYFRLKDIDIDLGSTGYSPVKALMLSDRKGNVVIWPNPVTSQVTISNDNQQKYTRVRLTDLTGKIMVDRALEADLTDVNVADLPAGIYIIRIENNNGAYYSQKIVKQ